MIFRREAAYAETATDLDATVFLSVGGEEGREAVVGDGPESPGGFGGHHAFYLQLASRQYPSLGLHWAELEGETHQSVIASAVVRGLRCVLG